MVNAVQVPLAVHKKRALNNFEELITARENSTESKLKPKSQFTSEGTSLPATLPTGGLRASRAYDLALHRLRVSELKCQASEAKYKELAKQIAGSKTVKKKKAARVEVYAYDDLRLTTTTTKLYTFKSIIRIVQPSA